MKIIFFGRLSDVTNSNEIILEDIKSVKELIDHLESNFASLKNERYRIAVNKKIVDKDHGLKADDEVALLPPYAGG